MIDITPDLINGIFEIFGGFFILNHVRVLYKAKAVAGVSIMSTVFFNAWGVWNLYYYPHLEQWMSALGGAFIVLANTLYVGMLIYYAYYYKEEESTIEVGGKKIHVHQGNVAMIEVDEELDAYVNNLVNEASVHIPYGEYKKVIPLTRETVDKIEELVDGVEVDLDSPLEDDDESK